MQSAKKLAGLPGINSPSPQLRQSSLSMASAGSRSQSPKQLSLRAKPIQGYQMPSTQFTQPSVRTNHDQSLFSEITQQREMLGKRKIPAKGAIGKLEAIGQVWSLNEK